MDDDASDFLYATLAFLCCCVALMGGVLGIRGVVLDRPEDVAAAFREINFALLIWFGWEMFDRLTTAGMERSIRRIHERHEAENPEG